MSEKGSSKSLSLWFQILSLLGLGLIPLIVYRTIMDNPVPASQPQFIGLVFIIICMLGAIVGVRPSSFSRSARRKSRHQDNSGSQEMDLHKQDSTLRGHHYSCDLFSDHVLHFGGKILCAGCTGLTTGAVIAIVGSIGYFFFGISFINGILSFWLGISWVFFGLVQHKLYRVLSIRSGFFRYTLNVVFVLGAFLILVGADQLTENFVVNLYIICVILLWITNRIMMSSSEHERICEQCNIESCSHPT